MSMVDVEQSSLAKRFHEQGEDDTPLAEGTVGRLDGERRFDMLLSIFACLAVLGASAFFLGRFGTVLHTDALAISISCYGAVFALAVNIGIWVRSHYRHTEPRPFEFMVLWTLINVVYVTTVLDWDSILGASS